MDNETPTLFGLPVHETDNLPVPEVIVLPPTCSPEELAHFRATFHDALARLTQPSDRARQAMEELGLIAQRDQNRAAIDGALALPPRLLESKQIRTPAAGLPIVVSDAVPEGMIIAVDHGTPGGDSRAVVIADMLSAAGSETNAAVQALADKMAQVHQAIDTCGEAMDAYAHTRVMLYPPLRITISGHTAVATSEFADYERALLDLYARYRVFAFDDIRRWFAAYCTTSVHDWRDCYEWAKENPLWIPDTERQAKYEELAAHLRVFVPRAYKVLAATFREVTRTIRETFPTPRGYSPRRAARRRHQHKVKR